MYSAFVRFSCNNKDYKVDYVHDGDHNMLSINGEAFDFDEAMHDVMGVPYFIDIPHVPKFLDFLYNFGFDKNTKKKIFGTKREGFRAEGHKVCSSGTVKHVFVYMSRKGDITVYEKVWTNTIADTRLPFKDIK